MFYLLTHDIHINNIWTFKPPTSFCKPSRPNYRSILNTDPVKVLQMTAAYINIDNKIRDTPYTVTYSLTSNPIDEFAVSVY